MLFQKVDFKSPVNQPTLEFTSTNGIGRITAPEIDNSVRSLMNERSARPYFGWFDPLRALLALAVFIAHAKVLPANQPIADLGLHAVNVFFALSGFLVGGILLEKAHSGQAFWATVPRFYFNRCIRIWVPYYLLIITYVALVAMRGLWSEDLNQRLIPALTYTHNWANYREGLTAALAPINHIWSLAVEEQFYLLCPLLVGLVSDRRLVIALMIALTAFLPLYLDVHYYSCIALGVAAAAAYQMMPANKWYWFQQFSLLVGIPAFCVMMFFEHEPGSLLLAVAATLVVVGCSTECPGTRFTRLLGAMSYSFYLFHWLGFYLVNPIAEKLPEAIAVPTGMLLAFSVSIGASYASVKFIERPLLQRRELIAQRIPRVSATATAVAGSATLLGIWWTWAL